jgi:hypothetical protein
MNRYALVITLLISNLTYSMELAEPKYVMSENIITHRKHVHALCSSTYLMLADFKPQLQSVSALVNVIDQMNSLKLAQPPIRETEIGFFILKKNPTLTFVESLKKPFSVIPNPAAASIFFSRLAAYNDEIGKKAFVSPNAIQASNYLKAQNIDRIVAKNAERGIIIPQQIIDEMIIPAPGSVGVSEFLQLMHDIADIIKDNPEDTLLSAESIYHNELNGKASAISQ